MKILSIRHFHMKKIILPFLLLFALGSNAQIYPDGTVIQGFSATDINNNFFSSTIATNNGKHIIIDFSATWCSFCWNYHGTKVLDRYNDKFGPSGTDAQDAEVLFYEADASTNSNDLNGFGTNTQGDWVTGTSYKIFNETSNISNVQSSFTATSLGYPTVFLVCADKKMYRLATNITDENQMRTFVNQKCGTTPLNVNSTNAIDFSYQIFPNPAHETLFLKLNLNKKSETKYTLTNAVGQAVLEADEGNLSAGTYDFSAKIGSLPAGLYILNLQIGSESIAQKIMIQ